MNKTSGQEGTAAVELVIVAPALLLLIAVVAASGRIVSTKSALEAAAREAARAASQAPDADTAERVARKRARAVIEGARLNADKLDINTDTGDFQRGAPIGVDLSYDVELSDLPGFGLIPGSFELASGQLETVEAHKSR